VRQLPAFALFICCAFIPSCPAQDQFESIRASILNQMQQHKAPSIAVAVAQGGHILWEQGFGWADREKRIPADENTMYSLASISKPLTATALMTLVAAGKVDLDKPVNDYLGDAKIRAQIGNADDATVWRVANHSSGLPEHFQFFYRNESWRAPSFDETILRFGNLVTLPGEQFQYSNHGCGVLNDVIWRVSGKSFADYMRQEIFLKLGMTRSAVGNDTALAQYEATRYDGEDATPIVYYDTDHPGASEIYASAHDLALFGMFSLKAHLPSQSAILPDALIDAMQKPSIFFDPGAGYGIGWQSETRNGITIVSHSGGMPGVSTWLRLVPAQNLVIVVLSNSDDQLAHIVADQITLKLVANWKLSPPAAPEPAFIPPPDLVGKWSGTVQTYRSSIPFHLEVFPSGEIRVNLGNQLGTILDQVSFQDGTLYGMFKGNIDLPEAARRPYVLSVNLKLRDGKVLNGAISARATEAGTMPVYNVFLSGPEIPQSVRVEKGAFVLTQWADLHK
jgi:CubicO group peptidase (beta-lactamase class C family)